MSMRARKDACMAAVSSCSSKVKKYDSTICPDCTCSETLALEGYLRKALRGLRTPEKDFAVHPPPKQKCSYYWAVRHPRIDGSQGEGGQTFVRN